ncbi:hypothetical protein NE850_27655 [Paraburkholderia sp. USG1]|uniref:hypothetical protein n=1 Tax=Paraburkholderia sp. USG1 TaxID=2952268 RepID=UPI002867704E|nr:hypothetical protein [Paraburkholderia sp. USG1]MDR8400090.1 hypothetical protein [Paraburkholderia sp. USG1]
MTEQQFADFAAQGRVKLGPEAKAVIEQIAVDAIKRHPNYPRTCLSCGAQESLDGSVPCGH